MEQKYLVLLILTVLVLTTLLILNFVFYFKLRSDLLTLQQNYTYFLGNKVYVNETVNRLNSCVGGVDNLANVHPYDYNHDGLISGNEYCLRFNKTCIMGGWGEWGSDRYFYPVECSEMKQINSTGIIAFLCC